MADAYRDVGRMGVKVSTDRGFTLICRLVRSRRMSVTLAAAAAAAAVCLPAFADILPHPRCYVTPSLLAAAVRDGVVVYGA